MKHNILAVIHLSLTALALAVSAPAQSCATGDPLKPIRPTPTFISQEGTATLCGISEYTTPSTPPKKYRKQTLTGEVRICGYSNSTTCSTVPDANGQAYVWSGSFVYDANTCAITNTQFQDFYSAGSTSPCSLGPLAQHNAVGVTGWMGVSTGSPGQTRILTPTEDKWTFAICTPYPAFNRSESANGFAQANLSDEDTEADALKRAVTTQGSNNTAYQASRTTGFSFGFRKVQYTATFNVVCEGEYDVHLNYSVKPHGAAGPVTTETAITRQTLKSGQRTVTGEIKVLKPDTDYTLVNVELHAPCGEKPAGDADMRVSSVDVALNLGRGVSATSTGQLLLRAATITAGLYTPAALTAAITQDGSVEVVRDSSSALRQIKAPQTLADIVTFGASAYEVRFYASVGVGAQDPITKIYAVGGTPYVTYKFENPDASGTTRLRITETRGSITRVNEYAYDSGTTTWSLSTGNGLRQESLAITTAGGDTTKTTTISNSSTAVSKVAKTYRTFPWGDELISEILDPTGAALVTTYEYYSNQATDGGAYGRLKQRTNANGLWERHTYDSLGRPLLSVRPYLDSLITDPNTQSRVTDKSYSTLADADGDGLPEQLITTTETTLGTETGRTHLVEWSKPVTLGAETFARRTDIRCVTAGAAWNATDNLFAETLTYTADPLNGRTRRVVNPDGTATLTTYTIAVNGEQTTVTQTGQPNAALDAIVAGTRTTTITSAQGQVTGETTTDIASNLTLSAWTATQFDALGRPTRLDHADGTYETRDYACCGLASVRDRTGAVTTYTYDALGRLTDVTRAGLTTHTTYDADGRAKTVSRIGSDNSPMLQATNTYDLAGRLTERKDALNRATGSAEAFDSGTGHTTRTTTNPDGGTVIQVSARDGSLLSVAGTAAAPRAYEYGLESGQLFTKEIRVGEEGATTEWTKTYTDFAGRSYKTVLADGATNQSYFNAAGQLVKQTDPDGIATLFAYNARGEQEVTALDLDADGLIDYDGTDRITKTVTAVTTNGSYTVQRATTTVWETDTVDTATTVSISDQSADGLRSWQTVRGLTTTSVTALDGSGGRTVTTTAPDGTVTTQVFSSDRLSSQVTSHPSLGTLGSTTYGYDAHNRQISATDARNGATTFAYFADDQLQSTTTPDPDASQSGPGYDPQTTTYAYDAAGRPSQDTEPDGGIKTTEYYPTGLIKKYTGARQYPEERTYDAQGRLKTLKTWQNYAGDSGTAVTTWNYDPQRGFLLNKRYADNTGPSYTYKPSGRLLARTWARGIVTTYGYSAAGDLNSVDYSDSTPDVAITYDRLGRPKTRTDGSGVCNWTYHASGQLEDETYTSGPLTGLGLDRSFDSLARLNGLSALSALNQISYSFDSSSRLSVVTQGANSATYGYLANSPLVQSVTFANSGVTRLVATKSYDNLNRLSSITNTPSASTVLSHAYDYNSANQRVKLTRETNAYWDFSYDSLGQVTSASKKLTGGAAVLGHSFGFTFDDIGNRKTSTANGQTSNYTPNSLNQYAQRTIPGSFDVLGEAQPDATVTVAHPAATGLPQAAIRQGETFYKQLSVDNASVPQYAAVKVTGVKNLVGPNGEDAVTEETRSILVPAAQETYAHDTDGNLTDDARWHYTWDAENRLIAVESSASAVTVGAPKRKVEFTYDGQSRRISKKVFSWNLALATWNLESATLFLYDGWNLLAELDALATNAPIRTYVWGLDLSGSRQDAGGVGGLLFTKLDASTHAAAYDGSENIAAYVDMATGAKSATYEYGAFGETLIADGPLAEAFAFRFSTKYQDTETGFYNYGLRIFQPGTGRWLSKDPVQEQGGVNLYGFVGNNPISRIDFLGLWSDTEHYRIIRSWLIRRNNKLPPDSSYTNYKWKCIRLNVYLHLTEGNDEVDGTGRYGFNFSQAQAVGNSYQHAMRAPGQTVADARNKMYGFVFKELREAKEAASAARYYWSISRKETAAFMMDRAIHHLGRAQHPIADSTSPRHRGFQVWRGLAAVIPGLIHHFGEGEEEFAEEGSNPVDTVSGFFDASLDEVLSEN